MKLRTIVEDDFESMGGKKVHLEMLLRDIGHRFQYVITEEEILAYLTEFYNVGTVYVKKFKNEVKNTLYVAVENTEFLKKVTGIDKDIIILDGRRQSIYSIKDYIMKKTMVGSFLDDDILEKLTDEIKIVFDLNKQNYIIILPEDFNRVDDKIKDKIFVNKGIAYRMHERRYITKVEDENNSLLNEIINKCVNEKLKAEVVFDKKYSYSFSDTVVENYLYDAKVGFTPFGEYSQTVRVRYSNEFSSHYLMNDRDLRSKKR